jgi:DnaJ-class molecular chaperone
MKSNYYIIKEISTNRDIYKTCCSILGISENFTPQELRKAYREKARKYHPDHNDGSEESKKRFIILKCAYDFLLNGSFSEFSINSIYGEEEREKKNFWRIFSSWKNQFFDFSYTKKNTNRKSCI